MRMSAAFLIAWGMAAVCAYGQVGAPGAKRLMRTDDILNQRMPEVSFEDAPFDQVLDWIANITGLDIVVRWEQLENQGVERDKAITVRVKNLRLTQVLWMIMNEVGGDVKLAYRASGTLLVLSTAEDLGKEMITKVYDVSDLLVKLPRFRNAPQIDLTQQTGGGAGGGTGGQIFSQTGGGQDDEENDQGDEQDDEEMQKLIELITQTVEPDSWAVNGAGPGTIHAFRRQIVVRNNILVHQRLGGAIEE